MRENVESLHSADVLERLQKDLAKRLGPTIQCEIELQVFLPYNVQIRYVAGRYMLRVCMLIGFDEEEYQSTVDYIVRWVKDHEEELQYRDQLSHRAPLADRGEKELVSILPGEESAAKLVSARDWNNQGYELAEREQWKEAIPYYRRALELDPQHAMAWSNLGNALRATGSLEEALECQSRAVDLDPEFALGWANKAVTLASLDRREDALPCYGRALELDPHNRITWFSKASTLMILGRLEESLRCFEHILEHLDPRMKDALGAKIEVLQKMGRSEEALRALEDLLTVDPTDARALASKGWLLIDLGRYDDALSCYDRLLHIEPRSATAWFGKGVALLETERPREAHEVFRRAQQLGHPDAGKAIEICQNRLRAATSSTGRATIESFEEWLERSEELDQETAAFCRDLLRWLTIYSAIDGGVRHGTVMPEQIRRQLDDIASGLARGSAPAEIVVHNAIAWRLRGDWLLDEPGYGETLSPEVIETYRGLAYAVAVFAGATAGVERARDLSQAFFDLLWPAADQVYVSLTPKGRLHLRRVQAIRKQITEVRLEARGRSAALTLADRSSKVCELVASHQQWLDLYLCLCLEPRFQIPASQRFRLGTSELAIRYKVGGIIEVGGSVLHVGGPSESFFFDQLQEQLGLYASEQRHEVTDLLERLDVLLAWVEKQLAVESGQELLRAGVRDPAWAALQSVGIAIAMDPQRSALERVAARLDEAGRDLREDLTTGS
jgi:tetratricopeptide (TPR) repeat protein